MYKLVSGSNSSISLLFRNIDLIEEIVKKKFKDCIWVVRNAGWLGIYFVFWVYWYFLIFSNICIYYWFFIFYVNILKVLKFKNKMIVKFFDIYFIIRVIFIYWSFEDKLCW